MKSVDQAVADKCVYFRQAQPDLHCYANEVCENHDL